MITERQKKWKMAEFYEQQLDVLFLAPTLSKRERERDDGIAIYRTSNLTF